MSKASKNITLRDRLQICCVRKTQSQSTFPRSADKYKTQKYHKNLPIQKKSIKTKNLLKPQFDLSYRRKHQRNSFLQFYRKKSLICPVNHLKAQDLTNFKILGTFDKKIIVGFNQSLNLFCFFDQHAMHQRIRYQYYLQRLDIFDKTDKNTKKWDQQIIQKERKTIEVISGIRHSYTSLKVINSLNDIIPIDISVSKYGFQIQYIKKQMTLKIKKVPLILQKTLQNKILLDIAHSLIMDPDNLPKSLQSIIAQISCKSAFKFNDQLSSSLIQSLIKNLSLCQYPFFCVHGRPTLFTRI